MEGAPYASHSGCVALNPRDLGESLLLISHSQSSVKPKLVMPTASSWPPWCVLYSPCPLFSLQNYPLAHSLPHWWAGSLFLSRHHLPQGLCSCCSHLEPGFFPHFLELSLKCHIFSNTSANGPINKGSPSLVLRLLHHTWLLFLWFMKSLLSQQNTNPARAEHLPVCSLLCPWHKLSARRREVLQGPVGSVDRHPDKRACKSAFPECMEVSVVCHNVLVPFHTWSHELPDTQP